MNNYEYIIASLPDISPEWKFKEGQSAETIIDEIRSQCSKKDNELITVLTDGFVGENLNAEFYTKAFKCSNKFIREYFKFDLNMRNHKVAYLNEYLGREEGLDVLKLDAGDFPQAEQVDAILRGNDILAKERGLDDMMWDKITSLIEFQYFNIEVILAFIAKLNIVNRWLVLDDSIGRELLKKLVSEVRGTFGGVRYNEDEDQES